MQFVPAVNVLMAEVRQLLHDQQIENVLYFRYGTQPTLQQSASLGQALVDWWANDLAANLSSDLVLREIYLTDLTSQTSFTNTVTPVPLPQGAVSGGGLPGNVAYCVKLRTAGRGRSARGRNYVAGLPEEDVTGNTFASARANGVVASYDALVQGLAAEGNPLLVVISRITGGQPRTTALIQPVTSANATDLFVDSQRRRLTTRGN